MSMEPFFCDIRNGKVPSVEESMKYEGLRLATFHIRPRSYNTPAPKLVHAGFYYTGKADIVACFKCGVRVGKWESLGLHVDPFIIHSERSPNCAFLSNGKENVPYTTNGEELLPKKFKQRIRERISSHEPSVKLRERIDSAKPERRSFQQELSRRQRGDIETDAPGQTGPVFNNSQSNKSFARLSYLSNNSLFNGSNTPPPPERINNPLQTPRFFDDHISSPPMVDDNLQGGNNFKDEQTRLDSFTYWPNGSAVRPSELARAGFHYLGTEDRVQCAFCKGVLRNWEATDIVLEEHKKHFPSCPFMRDPKSVGNIPRQDQLTGVNMRKDVSPDKELEEYLMGIMTQKAYHPHMAVKVDRLNSFVNFFSDSKRTPEEFADAGFYFTGQGDNVKCFFCDGGLRNWERNDDPWLEHARWFPKCDYLRTKKGDDYIRDIRKRYSPPGSKKPRIKKLKSRHNVNEREVEEIMRSDMVLDATDIGFTHSQIKHSVRRRLAELGSSFPNVESLIESLYEDEELAQQDSADSDSDSEVYDEGHRLSPELQDEKIDSADNSGNGTKNEKNEKKRNRRRKRNKKKQGTAAQINPIDLMSDEKNTALAAEVQKMKEERLCKVCLDSEVNIVFLKCGHLVCCSDCAPALRHCPICRQNIRGTIRVFIS